MQGSPGPLQPTVNVDSVELGLGLKRPRTEGRSPNAAQQSWVIPVAWASRGSSRPLTDFSGGGACCSERGSERGSEPGEACRSSPGPAALRCLPGDKSRRRLSPQPGLTQFFTWLRRHYLGDPLARGPLRWAATPEHSCDHAATLLTSPQRLT